MTKKCMNCGAEVLHYTVFMKVEALQCSACVHTRIPELDDLRRQLEQAKADREAEIAKLKGGLYYHDLHCNASRDKPMGCQGCSCIMYRRAKEAEATNKRLQGIAENAKAAKADAEQLLASVRTLLIDAKADFALRQGDS